MVGPRVFTEDEAQLLVPVICEAFERVDELRESLREAKLKLSTLEMLWGTELRKPKCPDHEEAGALVESLQEFQGGVAGIVQELAEKGVTVKDVASGLADVYHVRDGRLVFLCWKRGEETLEAWHHVDEGFAARQSL